MNDDSSQKGKENSNHDQEAEENDAVEDKSHRRIQDGITSKTPTRKMDLDRRYKNSERRSIKDIAYKGWARRFTIDRRKTTKDRRNID